ncbi:MAG: hypothetical protein HFACDABA_01658 [Anaerolineales bacterium]|nr:hypothetical protein [Anaerolineales bacterium]
MPLPPAWALALFYWIHLLATVTWIGGIAAISILVLPAARRTLQPLDQLAFLEAMQRRLEPLAWFSITALIATGLFQMSANEHYNGFLNASTQWSLSILVKHGLGLVMGAVTALQTWEIFPAIRRTLMRKEKGASAQEIILLQKREERLRKINLLLAVLILGATALARAA